MLLESKKLADAYVIARRIVEIFIRNEYLHKNNRYLDYNNEKYLEKAKMLRAMIKSHRVKDIINNPLWLERHTIIKANKKLWNDIHKNKTISEIPKLEDMANNTGMSYLYKITYSNWSKIVHCNMSSEGASRYNHQGNLFYDFPENKSMDYSKNKGIARQLIACVNQCMYQYIKIYCERNNIRPNIISELKTKMF